MMFVRNGQDGCGETNECETEYVAGDEWDETFADGDVESRKFEESYDAVPSIWDGVICGMERMTYRRGRRCGGGARR